MRSSLYMLMNLPTAAKAGGGVAGGGLLFFLLYFFSGSAFFIILIGMVAVGLLLGIYSYILKRRKKRKAAPLERNLMDNTAAASQDVSEPAQRALLDDLRKRFEKGVQVFRSLGKDLYSTPWFLIIGESGSGKTEAIRHCNLPFPPNLTDPLQGAGGTMNMDWWFTKDAVIVDTAGKMLFEEAKTGTNDRWRELLALLKKCRPNEPINGLLLVLPADNLISDSAEEIERKAAKFAQQLDLIQRTLDVRFPAFVVVTKCDLINGFREFFYNLDDPKLQHQMLGWSNPAQLDEPYDTTQVAEHMKSVLHRLGRRRTALLQDVVLNDALDAHRDEVVNPLYAFPKSVELIVPRLQRYMEMIFVSNEWAAKPLFLRGIYFTSSMQEGATLDEELADVLGVPPGSLPEGGIWKRDRAYFLRDLFTEKIFREKKLVTRATSAKKVHTKRNALVLGAGFAAVVLLFFLTWFGAHSMQKSIGLERDQWVAGAYEKNWDNGCWKPIVVRPFQGTTNYDYRGHDIVHFPKKLGEKAGDAGHLKDSKGNKLTIERFHPDLLNRIQKGNIHVPWIFSFATVFNRGINKNREDGQRTLFDAGVLRPLVDATRDTMTREADEFGPDADDTDAAETDIEAVVNALAQLVRLEADKLNGLPEDKLRDPLLEVDTLLHYAIDAGKEVQAEIEEPDEDKEPEAAQPDTEAFKSVLQRTYARKSARGHWPPDLLKAGSEEAHEAVTAGVELFRDYWSTQVKDNQRQGGDLATLNSLAVSLDKFGNAEERFLRGVGEKPPTTMMEFKAWDGGFDRLQAAFREVEALNAEELLDGKSLREAAGTVKQSMLEDVDGQYDALLYNEILTPLAGRLSEVMEEDDPLPVAARAALETKPRPGEPEYQKLREDIAGALDDTDFELAAQTRFLLQMAHQLMTNWQEPRAELDKFLQNKQLDRLDEQFLATVPEDSLMKLKRVDKDLWERIKISPRLYNARYAMYSLANNLLGKEDKLPRIDGIRGTMTKIDEDVEAAGVKIGLLHDLNKKGYLFVKASGAAEIMRSAALRSRNYRVFSKFLIDDHPKSAKDIATLVAGIAKALPPIRQPRIRMTDMGGGTFDLKYHPAGSGSVLKGWAGLVQELGKDTMETLERDRLRRRQQDLRGVYEGYEKAYVDYWTVKVVPKIDSFDSWATFLQVVQRQEADAAVLNAGLEKLGKQMLSALDAAKPYLPHGSFEKERSTFQESLDNLENLVFLRKCETICNNWRDLPNDACKARTKALGDPLGDYWLSEALDSGYVGTVWRNLAHEGIRVMGKNYAQAVTNTVSMVCDKYNKFPLNKSARAELTEAELHKARQLVDEVGYCDPARFKIRPDDPRTALVKAAAIECRAITKLKAVLDALPPEGKSFKCRLSITDASEIATQWRVMEVCQDGKRVGGRLFLPGKGESRDVKYPADLVIKLFRHPTDKEPDQQKSFKGTWAPIRLIFNADRMQNGKQWKLSLPWTDNKGNVRRSQLHLEFEKAFPGSDDWPACP